MDAKGEPNGVLVLGEVKDAASFRTYLDGQLARFAKESGDMPNIRIIDDPLTAKVDEYFRSSKTAKTKLRDEKRRDEIRTVRLDQQRHLRGITADRKSARAGDDTECAGRESLREFVVSSAHQRCLQRRRGTRGRRRPRKDRRSGGQQR